MMSLFLKRYAVCILGVALAWFSWWLWLRGDEAEMLARNRVLIAQLEERDWGAVEALLAADYADGFGQNRQQALAHLQEGLGVFLSLEIQLSAELAESRGEKEGEVRFMAKIRGLGAGGVDQIIKREVNELKQPWQLSWKKVGIWPWNWSLKSVNQAELAEKAPLYVH
jgi:hypothetical protein